MDEVSELPGATLPPAGRPLAVDGETAVAFGRTMKIEIAGTAAEVSDHGPEVRVGQAVEQGTRMAESTSVEPLPLAEAEEQRRRNELAEQNPIALDEPAAAEAPPPSVASAVSAATPAKRAGGQLEPRTVRPRGMAADKPDWTNRRVRVQFSDGWHRGTALERFEVTGGIVWRVLFDDGEDLRVPEKTLLPANEAAAPAAPVVPVAAAAPAVAPAPKTEMGEAEMEVKTERTSAGKTEGAAEAIIAEVKMEGAEEPRYDGRQLFHRNALVQALQLQSIGKGGPCVTTRNWSRDAELFPDQGPQTKTPVVCLNDAWHPLAPRFAGDRHATLFCHGDCLDGETISLIVRRRSASGKVLGHEYCGQYRLRERSPHGHADLSGDRMAEARRTYATCLHTQENMAGVREQCARDLGLAASLSAQEKAKLIMDKVGTNDLDLHVFPAIYIEFAGYKEAVFQRLMTAKAYEYKSYSYQGQLAERRETACG